MGKNLGAYENYSGPKVVKHFAIRTFVLTTIVVGLMIAFEKHLRLRVDGVLGAISSITIFFETIKFMDLGQFPLKTSLLPIFLGFTLGLLASGAALFILREIGLL